MDIQGVSDYQMTGVQEAVSVGMLKKSMDFQEQAALHLLQSLPQVQDPMLGNNIDTYA